MADNVPRLHVVCYDITDPRRLVRVHRFLVKRGMPLQYSVFLVYMTKYGLLELIGELRGLIESKSDDVRAYPLPRQPEYSHLGRQLFPAGVSLVGKGFQLPLFGGGRRRR